MAILAQKQTGGSHWYTVDGRPMHRVPKADGKGDKAATVADARKLGLLPSVTGVISIFDKPPLNKWKMEKVALAAVKVARGQQEDDKAWCSRVIDVAMNETEIAKDLGTDIHAALEAAILGEPWNQELAVYVQPVLDWWKEKGIRVEAVEKILVNPEEGFAGTVDVLFRYGKNGIGILDYKTKKTKPGEKVEAYQEHSMQLAAYAATYWGVDCLDDVLAANIFISTTEPGRFEVCKHDQLAKHYQAFLNACALYRYVKDFDPRQKSMKLTSRRQQLESLAADGDEAAAAELEQGVA